MGQLQGGACRENVKQWADAKTRQIILPQLKAAKAGCCRGLGSEGMQAALSAPRRLVSISMEDRMGKQSLKGLRRVAVRGIVRVHLYVDTYEGRAVLWGLCLFLGLLCSALSR